MISIHFHLNTNNDIKKCAFRAGMSEIAIREKINGTEREWTGRNKIEW
jgi:hypothetical protein